MKTLSSLQARRLVAGYGKKLILDNVDVVVPPNKISVIIGANACGKSTLLKTLARLIKPTSGEVMLDGKDIHAIHPKKVAKKLGLLPQSPGGAGRHHGCRPCFPRPVPTSKPYGRIEKERL